MIETNERIIKHKVGLLNLYSNNYTGSATSAI